MILADLASRAQTASRSSGTATRPIFASRVENGYFVASAACVAVNALNKADLPTFGRPTMPQLKPIDLRGRCGGGRGRLGRSQTARHLAHKGVGRPRQQQWNGLGDSFDQRLDPIGDLVGGE